MGIFKDLVGEQEEEVGMGFTIPDTNGILERLAEELRADHKFKTEEIEKQGGAKKSGRQQRRGGVICCCGVPYCGIGPMVQMG